VVPDAGHPEAGGARDGLSLVGRRMRFTDSRAQERSAEGVVFYSR
jgi:hypothetical protein